MVETPASSLQPLSDFLDLLHCAAALIHRTGRIVHANDRLCSLLGQPDGALVGRNLRELYADPDARQAIEQVLEHFDSPREEEFFLPLRDGRRLPVIVSGRPVLNGADLRVVTLIDISRQKKAEHQVREQYQAILHLSDNLLARALEWKQRSRALTQRLDAAHMDSIYMLAVASEAKDADTGLHVRRIQYSAEAMARKLGQSDEDAEMMGVAAILHDVGKLLVPDEILKKPSELTDEERRTMELHTIAGEKILPDKPFYRNARQIARSHHENWDGSGYPDGLRGEVIPLAARIVHIVDVYDALTSERVYKGAEKPADALTMVLQSAGVYFDPSLMHAFTSLCTQGVFQNLAAQIDEASRHDDWSGIRVPALQ